jgi:hypothetical protein
MNEEALPANPARPQVPLEPFLPTMPEGVNGNAQREARGFAAGNLEEISKRSEHRRSERFRDHISNAALCVIWVLFVLFMFAGTFLAWHYLMPRKWGWLEQDQLDTLRTIVFSGAITSTATAYFIKRV